MELECIIQGIKLSFHRTCAWIILNILMTLFSGKDGKLYVFRLTDFEGEQNEDVVRNKQDCREHKIDKAKGKFLSLWVKQ